MRGVVFHHEVSSCHCSVLIELYNGLKLPIVADENDTYTCLRHFVPEKIASCRGGQTIHFVFISVN